MTEEQSKQKAETDKNCRTCEYDGGIICLCETVCKNRDRWKKAEDKESE